MRRAEALATERARTAFLAEAGRRLAATLHQGTLPDRLLIEVPQPDGWPGFRSGRAICQTSRRRRVGGQRRGGGGRLARGWPPPSRDPQIAAVLGDDEYTYVVRNRPTLIATAMHRLAEACPAVRDHDDRQRDATAEDMGHVVDFLAAALYLSETLIFTDFVDWTAGVRHAREVPPRAFRAGLDLVRAQLTDYPAALAMLDAGRAHLPG